MSTYSVNIQKSIDRVYMYRASIVSIDRLSIDKVPTDKVSMYSVSTDSVKIQNINIHRVNRQRVNRQVSPINKTQTNVTISVCFEAVGFNNRLVL